MSDHISTEEAERIAFAIQGRAMEVTGAGELVYDEELRDTADALRALAAERDRLGNEVEHHVEELDLRMKAILALAKRMAALAAERDALRKHLRVLTTEAAIVFEDSRIASYIEIQVDKAGWYEARAAIGEEDG